MMAGVDVAEHLGHLEREGRALAGAAGQAGLDTRVPGCPDWNVRDLVAHVGEVHRWAATIVREGRQGFDVTPPEVPGDGDLIEWFRSGHAGLLETLRGASADLDCATFLPSPSPLEFWARRQALETAIHRTDAQAAAGSVDPIDEALAADGIDEVVVGFGGFRREFEPGTIDLLPVGAAPWRLLLGPAGVSTASPDGDGGADVTVSGSASDVYQWLWNRPAEVDIAGDADVAARWRRVRVRWG
jgi:uncharacterized protein (TIGR03083 family)